MSIIQKTYRAFFLAILSTIATSSPSIAATEFLVNGSMEGPIGMGTLPTGWALDVGTCDTQSSGVLAIGTWGVTASDSPNGGTFFACGGTSNTLERFKQTITGLSVGTEYTLSFSAANFDWQYLTYDFGPGKWRVLVDGNVVYSTPSIPAAPGWQMFTFSFTPSSTTAVLAFEPILTDPTLSYTYLLIDGLSTMTTEDFNTVNNPGPSITSATYDASTGVLVVTGTNFVANDGAANDVDVSMLTLTGEGAPDVAHALTSDDVEIQSDTQFTINLNAADQAALASIFNKNGTSANDSTTYNIAAAEDWMPGAPSADNIADLTSNGVTVSGLDGTPPVFDASTPSVNTITSSSFTPLASIDEAGIIYYVVVADGDGAPNSAQVKNGLNSGGSLAISNGSLSVSSGDFTATFPAINSLTADTAYDVYFVAEDTAEVPNLQSSPTKVDVRTSATDSDADLTASGTVSEPVGLDSTVDTSGEAFDLFDFTITDGGSSDGFATNVTQIVVNVAGTTSDSVRGKITWRLNGPDASNVPGTYNPSNDTITFSGLSVSIADGGNETYTINGYFNDNTGLIEGQTFILSIDGDTDLTLDPSGTQMGSTSAVTNGAGATIDVVATTLAFTTQPAGSTSGSALSTQPVVAAQDAFGNTDVNFTETVTLTEASAGTLTNNSVAAVSGVATFTGVVYTATTDQQAFLLTANDQDGVGTDLSTVNANSVISDVVATALQFYTQPVPLTVEDRVATAFTTVPVVRAVDGNGVFDTGYSTDITLSEINGAGSATMNGTGDADSDGTTVTISPTSGVATFTGLTITYTQSGGSDETFNIQASSGGLTVANSSQLTSSDTITPSGYSASFDQGGINSSNETAASFTFAGAEVGASYDYTISSSGGGTNVTGTTDTISTPTDQITNINVSGLGDGTLTLSVKLTDAAGNEGQEATDTVTKDATAPSGYTVSFDQDSVNDGNQTAIGFTFANAEVEAKYSYIIVSDGGGAHVTGTGTITSASQSILNLNLSGLNDGTLVLSVTLTDPAGNTGSAAEDSIAKDVLAPIAPTSLSLAESSNSGSKTDTLTNDTTATINGTAEANATVTVYVGETEVGTATADSSGNWNFTFTEGDLATGENSITAKARDAAGNVSPTSSALMIIIDTGAPSLVITGPTDVVTEAFTLTFTFSEDVTGFDVNGITIVGGTLSGFSGSGDTYTVIVAPVLGETVTVSVAANAAIDAAGNGNEASETYTVQAGSPASEFEKYRDEIRQVVVDEAKRSLRSGLSANQRMVRGARDRFVAAQREQPACSEDDSELGNEETCDSELVTKNTVPLDVDGNFTLSENGLSTTGNFFQQVGNAEGTYRRLFFGDFDVQHDNETDSTTATLTGRLAWEQMTSDATMLGYFIGAEFASSNIGGSFEGDQDRIGLTAGGYIVHELSEQVYFDGFASVGSGRNNLKMDNDVLALESDYTTQTATLGGAITGVYSQKGYDFKPELAFSYGKTWLGDVGFTGRAYGLVDNTLSLDAGNVSIASLTFRPEVIVPIGADFVADTNTQLSFAPRLVCEQIKSTTKTSDCGTGGELGFSNTSEDGLSSAHMRILLDRINGGTRSSFVFSVEHKF